jgi:hypothetical protein
VTLAAYTGHETLTFPDYLNLATGKTLTAEPGESYDVSPASGRLVPDIPAALFTVTDEDRGDEDGETGGAWVAPTGLDDEQHDQEHDAGEAQQF